MKRPGKGCLCATAIAAIGVAIYVYFQIPKQKIELSRETTYFTGPVLENGRVDYFAALNQITSEGVTHENNAWVKLLETFELTDLSDADHAEDFQRELGVDLSKATHRYQSLESFHAARFPIDGDDYEAQDQLDQEFELLAAPWKSSDLPQSAAALETQNEALDLFAEAVKRPRFYVPISTLGVPKEDYLLLATLLTYAEHMRSAARDFRTRAMNRLGDGDIAGATEDIQTIRRLARLVRQSPFLIEQLDAIAIEGIGQDAEVKLVNSGLTTAEQLQEHLDFIRQPQPHRITLAKCIGVVERVTTLDSAIVIVREGGDISSMSPTSDHPLASPFLTRIADFDSVLIEINRQFDVMEDVANEPDRRKRLARMHEWEMMMEEQENSFYDSLGVTSIIFSTPRSRGTIIGKLLFLNLAGAMPQVDIAELRSSTENTLVEIAIANALYKSANGQYAESLSDFSPKWFAEIPQDWFGTGPLKYQRTDDGFVVYSVGRDGVDNGGRPYADGNLSKPGDQVLRIGPPKK